MAVLGSADRLKVRKGLARYWSQLRELVLLSGPNLLAAVDATDEWIDTNQGAFNNALPLEARTNLTAVQKTLIFCCVALMRVDPGVAQLLRRALGVEVN